MKVKILVTVFALFVALPVFAQDYNSYNSLLDHGYDLLNPGMTSDNCDFNARDLEDIYLLQGLNRQSEYNNQLNEYYNANTRQQEERALNNIREYNKRELQTQTLNQLLLDSLR